MADPFPGDDGLDPELADDLRGRIKAELQPGERLLWSGRGKPGKRSGCSPVVVWLWIAVCFAMSCSAIGAYFGWLGGAPVRDPVVVGFALVPAAVASLVVIGLVNEWLSSRASPPALAGGLYALTDRRAIIWRRSALRKGAVEVTSIPRGLTGMVRRVENADGSGDVLFSTLDTPTFDGPTIPQGFEGIPDVRRVEDLVRRALLVDESK